MVTCRAEFLMFPVSFVQMIWAAELLKTRYDDNNGQTLTLAQVLPGKPIQI